MKIFAYILEAIYNFTGVIHYHIKDFRIRTKVFMQKHYIAIGAFCALFFFSVLFIYFMIFVYKNFSLHSWGLVLYIFALLIGTWFSLFLLKFFIQETFPKYRTHLKSSQKFPFSNRLKTLEKKVVTTAQENKIPEYHHPIKPVLKFEDLFASKNLKDKVISTLKTNGIVDKEGSWISKCLGSGDATAICILLWKLKTLQLIKVPGKLTQRELCELSAAFFKFDYDFTMISKVFRDLNEKDIVDKSNYAPVLKKLRFLDDIAVYNR